MNKILLFLGIAWNVLITTISAGQTYPTGFSQVLVANGISSPTVMAFSPDGRLFVAQQNGQLRVIKNGVLQVKPFVSLSVNSSGERGLLGIAFDPSFASNQYIYLYYTLSSAANNRISRFTASGDTALPGSEVVVLNLDPLSSATNHNGGNMQFGPDGKLYVSIGENANSANAQNLDTYLGKVLRINSNGTVPSGNPFTSGSAQRQRVWSYGLRNPFTISFQPGTGRLFVNDVGQSSWEEIDEATSSGLNYGWPTTEGMGSTSGLTNPIYTYAHGSAIGQGCAITGGTFFNPSSTTYPSSYNGKYFFIDYCTAWIDYLTLSGSTATRSNFASGIAGSPVGIITGPDGNLYFLSRANNAVYKITYSGSSAPVITNQPQSLTVSQGNSATFSLTVTGTAPLSYQWRKNGSNISGANASSYTISSVTSSSAGQYSVVVSNSAGSTTSNNATLTVTSANQVPTAGITTPTAGATYAGGNTISFSGTGTDPEDGTLPASAFTWFVIFHHDTHTHPGPTAPSGVKTGSFTIPNSGETSANVFYRLYLVATDSQGAKDTVYTDILPRTSLITVATNPQGLTIELDGQPFTAPYTVTSVEGILRTIGVVNPQMVNNALIYNFSSWSQGGSQTQTFATSVNDATYTATFTPSLRTGENPSGTVNGLNYSYYQGSWNTLPDFSSLTATGSGNVAGFDISPRSQNDNFGFRFTGYISVPTDGIYTFYTSSDDGSKLYIGSTMVVNNDGLHGVQETSGQVGLKAGKHAIRVDFFELNGGEALTVSYAGPGISKQVIPNTALFRTGSSQTTTLTPVADAYVRQANPNDNYGIATKLLIKKAGGNDHETYLRFDISGVATTLSSAKLRLYGNIINTSVPSITAEVPNVTNTTWQENSITYSNRPAPSGSALSSVIVGSTLAYYEWDITTQVTALRNAGTNYISLLVRNVTSSTNDRINFNSKESSSNKPQLKIITSAPRMAESSTISSVPELKVYPNPARDKVLVEVPAELKGRDIILFDESGRTCLTVKIDQEQMEMNLSDLKNGIYFIHVATDIFDIRKKVLIQK